MKDLNYYRSKLLALRNALDAILAEMDAEQPAPAPPKRQNKRSERMLNFGAMYEKPKKK